MSITVGHIVERLDDSFPFTWAEPWDNVGLVVGDPSRTVQRVLVSLDADLPTIRRAHDMGANVLVTHHPPFLEAPTAIDPASSPVLWFAIQHDVSIITAHTNLDRSPQGSGVLLEALGLPPGRPIETSLADESLITVYAPAESADDIRTALAESGAGRISSYDGCTFSTEGEGRFLPRADASPGVEPHGSFVPEVRIEAVVSDSRAEGTARAVSHVHPYEEPLITVAAIARSRGSVALGRVADVPSATLSELVTSVARTFDCTPRVWGDPDAPVGRLATATGSASSLVRSAAATGADALLAGEVRYHDALDALHSGLAIIEAGHDVTEWPLVPVLAREIKCLEGIGDGVVVEEATRSWWTP
jgi:dinuclear metal center YbgI/SA1388 family protein